MKAAYPEGDRSILVSTDHGLSVAKWQVTQVLHTRVILW